MRRLWFFLLFPLSAISFSYEVDFIGLEDEKALRALRDGSQLVMLQYRPPASINGLRYRIAADIPNLIRILHAFAYYDATITSDVENNDGKVTVEIFIHPGPQFKLTSYSVYKGECKELAEIPGCCPLSPDTLGLQIGAPALSISIVNAELNILKELSRCGYPLAFVDKRKVEVDMASTKVEAAACIQEGPLSKFGPTTFFGVNEIHPRFINRKIAWKEGDIYNSDLIEETQKRLLKTELFSSVTISHGEELDAQNGLPMKLRLAEAKHKTLSLGLYYATIDGPGGTFAWTHRNVRGMGEIFSIDGDFSKRFLAGNIGYKKTDFLTVDQNYRAFFELSREKIHPYLAFTYRLANFIERALSPKKTVSVGVKFEHIKVLKSASNGTYLLVGMPFFGRFDNADNLLDPTKGYTLVYSITPYQSMWHAKERFAKQRLTGTFYVPLIPSRKLVLALKAQLGSISGAKRQEIPLTKLFLGGSEDDLRGYRYKTVSPVIGTSPLGGRSAIFTSAELRIRLMQKIGIVPFADFGTVTNSELPDFNAKWFKSIGLGIRYFAFFGPLRFDVARALDRRKHIDPPFQIYATVGQTF